MIAQKPVRLHSPAPQCPPAPAADKELLGSRCTNTLQMPGKAQGIHSLEILCIFFYTSALHGLSPGLISRRWCGFCWLSICCFPIFRGKGNPQRIFLLTLKFLQSLHCFSLFSLGVKSLDEWCRFFFLSLWPHIPQPFRELCDSV